jgi:SAM-dependent methyltransferase
VSGQIDRGAGRALFGADPARYDRARPGYPDRVWTVLRERCGVGPGAHVLEIGPGTGLATRRLLALGAGPLVAVEPDAALAEYLVSTLGPAAGRVDVLIAAFEEVAVPDAAFDAAVSASAFHWVEPATGLARVAAALAPGGWWAAWWNIHGDPDGSDPFHDATTAILRDLPRSPSGTTRPYALDADARGRELAAAGFVDIGHEVIRWTATFSTERTRELYATFSPIASRPPAERERVLDRVARVAEEEFGGRVDRPMVTAIHTARRPR